MPDKSKSPPPNTPKQPTPGKGKPRGTPDRWVDNQLRQLYNDVAAEPLPQDLLDLLNNIDLDDKPKGGGRS